MDIPHTNKIDSVEFISKSLVSIDELNDAFSSISSLHSKSSPDEKSINDLISRIYNVLRFEFADNINQSVLAGEFYSKEYSEKVV